MGAYSAEDFEHPEDLQRSHHIFTRFFGDEDEHEGGTVLVASAEVFEELRSKGSTEIDVVDIPGEKGTGSCRASSVRCALCSD